MTSRLVTLWICFDNCCTIDHGYALTTAAQFIHTMFIVSVYNLSAFDIYRTTSFALFRRVGCTQLQPNKAFVSSIFASALNTWQRPHPTIFHLKPLSIHLQMWIGSMRIRSGLVFCLQCGRDWYGLNADSMRNQCPVQTGLNYCFKINHCMTVIVNVLLLFRCFLYLLVVGSSWWLSSYTSKWSRDIEVHCVGCHQLVSVLFFSIPT